MVSHHDRNVPPLVPLSAKLHDAIFGAQERLGGGGSEGTDSSGPDSRKLPEQELTANLHFVRQRRSIFRRPAFHDVADIYIRAAEGNALLPGGTFDHLREELTSTADEGQALLIFIRSRALTDEHQPGAFIAGAEDELVATFVEAA